ncbi:MAG TPA: aspartate/glutamate racemase family protein [Ramlibacter sp.]|nr:aspartate/glutamate racemase family protein [Ramlibacter sp.]
MFPPDGPRPLGILMLDTHFPRPLGDVGNPASWPVPTLLRVVPRLAPRVVVQTAQGLRAAGVLPAMAEAMRELEQAGCAAITTSCGFLVLLQAQLQSAVRVPVVTSSLLQLPALLAREPQVGVLTISANHLGADHLRAAGVPARRRDDVLVQGVDPASEFARAILGDDPAMDLSRAGEGVLQAAGALARRAPGLRTVVLECTNMPPYAERIRAETGWQVLSLFDAAGLRMALH